MANDVNESRNIYRMARKVAGMTHERWAEAIGVDPRNVYRYEAGETTPSDDVVVAMAQISGLSPLCYWHLDRKIHGALDPVERMPLPQAVVNLLVAIEDFEDRHGDLLHVACDGKIMPDEISAWEQIRARLETVISAALAVKFAEGTP